MSLFLLYAWIASEEYPPDVNENEARLTLVLITPALFVVPAVKATARPVDCIFVPVKFTPAIVTP